MTQAKFMYELMTAAEGFSDDAKISLMNEYNEYFFDQKQQGRSEDEIISSLPSPEEIAAKMSSGKRAHPDEAPSENITDSVTALGVLFFILLIPVLIVYELLIAAFAVTGAVILLALCVAAAFASVACFGTSALSRGFILIGIGGLFITVALVLFSAAVFRFFGAAFSWLPRFMGNVRFFRRGRN